MIRNLGIERWNKKLGERDGLSKRGKRGGETGRDGKRNRES